MECIKIAITTTAQTTQIPIRALDQPCELRFYLNINITLISRRRILRLQKLFVAPTDAGTYVGHCNFKVQGVSQTVQFKALYCLFTSRTLLLFAVITIIIAAMNQKRLFIPLDHGPKIKP